MLLQEPGPKFEHVRDGFDDLDLFDRLFFGAPWRGTRDAPDYCLAAHRRSGRGDDLLRLRPTPRNSLDKGSVATRNPAERRQLDRLLEGRLEAWRGRCWNILPITKIDHSLQLWLA